MPKFIQIPDVQGNTMGINPDHIVMMKPSPDGDPEHPAVIQLVGGTPMKVKVSVEEIKQKIGLANRF